MSIIDLLMKVKRVFAVYFSPTGTTRTIVIHVAKKIARTLNIPMKKWDFTLPVQRKEIPMSGMTDLFILGLPVYAGRLPNLMLQYVSSFAGHGALAIPIVLFGNRSYGNALIELRDSLENTGFHTIAAAAFVGQHAFSCQLGKGRPDSDDLKSANLFAAKILSQIKNVPASGPMQPVSVPGKGAPDYEGYYQPLGQDGETVHLLKVKPVTTKDCIRCKRCAGVCPLGSIDPEDTGRVHGICMKCNACIKVCPVKAKQFTDPDYLSHLQHLESTYTSRSAVELF